MKLDEIDAFVAVVRCQSLSVAAHTLTLTQPAITRRIQSLEESLGVELLDRNTKPLKPTAMGRQVYEQCRAIVREVDTLRDLVATDTPPVGGLRLGVEPAISDLALLDGLRDLREMFPGLQTSVSTECGATLLNRLTRGEVDAAALLMPANTVFPDTLDAESIGHTELAVVAPKGALKRRAQALLDLQLYGWVLNPDGCGLRRVLQRGLAQRGASLKIQLETMGTELQLGLVADGVGLGIVARSALSTSPHIHDVDVIAVTDFKPRLDIWMVKPRFLGKLQQPVSRFATVVQQAFKTPRAEQAA
ncbi:MAG TPA: LysR family transcriptional regulator [Pararobbsia sp.]|nr:LysR family transcriptional regulator [Pararobbsia sp.]